MSMSSKKGVHADDKLRIGSQYLRYHVKMYAETLLWLQDHIDQPTGWDTAWNAILENHQVHARVLINFLCKSERKYPTDVLAIDYFHDHPNVFKPLQDEFLNSQANRIGNHLLMFA